MRHSLPLSPQFYVTAPQPCPYLGGQVERKLFTALHGDNANTLNDTLSRQGFRRSQNVLYRPSCSDCAACLSARIIAREFSPSRSYKRILRRNRDIVRSARSPWATEEQYDLFRRYLDSRHAGGGMAEMDIYEYAAMVEETPVRSRVVEYRVQTETDDDEGRLVAVCLTDVLSDGMSLVYSFFDPDEAERSLGTYMILDHVALACEAGLSYVYLGYWVPGSPKMGYKSRFRPLEIYYGRSWSRLRPGFRKTADLKSSPERERIAGQVSAIDLPPIRET
ncbi:MAG: arginyltransferase [Paracoccaceae bacterium]